MMAKRNKDMLVYLNSVIKALEVLKPYDQIYVGVALSKPGKHSYLVKFKSQQNYVDTLSSNSDEQSVFRDESDDFFYSFHSCLVSPRLEDPPLMQKAVKFLKSESIFFDWNVDTEFSLRECYKNDMGASTFLQEVVHTKN